MSAKTQLIRPDGQNEIPQTPKHPAPAGGVDSLYAQSVESSANNIKRTYIQGMKPRKVGTDNYTSAPSEKASPRVTDIELQERPLAGILYSVSCDECGEIFPVYVGRNTIGSDAQSDIYLSENTVSPNHALILVRVINSGARGRMVTMSISDNNSDFGTAVNGESILDDIVPIKAGDIIQIGNAYHFVYTPLRADQFGLSPIRSFQPTERAKNRPEVHSDFRNFIVINEDNDVYPNAVGEEHENTFYGRTKAKKEDNSSKKTM